MLVVFYFFTLSKTRDKVNSVVLSKVTETQSDFEETWYLNASLLDIILSFVCVIYYELSLYASAVKIHFGEQCVIYHKRT